MPQPEALETTSSAPKKRVGVKLRVLAAMGFAMSLFLLLLLLLIYLQISTVQTSHSAFHIVLSLAPFVFFILITCGVLFFALTNYFVLRPIRQIRDAALAISNGQLDTVISTTQNDEIGDLSRSVDQMANALKRDIQELQEVDKLKSEFIAISSHNLRTPLAGIKGGLDALQLSPLNEQTKKMLEIIRTSADNLIDFSEDMLTVASIEGRQAAAVGLVPTTLSDILTPLASYTNTIAGQRIRFLAKLADTDAQIVANPALLRLAFRNLLDNACKFTKDTDGIVELTSMQEKEHVTITIRDNGIGIPESEIPNLFTKFHRATNILTYDYEGVGMGLYIAKLILDQHNATITIKSAPNEGTEVTVHLPLAAKSPQTAFHGDR